MVKARRLWQDFDLGRRDDIARLIARASAYTGPGTKGYLAPEQTQLLDPDSFDLVAPDERFLLTSKTNVWVRALGYAYRAARHAFCMSRRAVLAAHTFMAVNIH